MGRSLTQCGRDGKFEVDLEGNFVRASNRNISSIRSSVPSIRRAWGRVDWHTSDKTTLFLLAGQDWTAFGSSTLPNLFETTGLGVGFGTRYERNPQFRFGIKQKLGGRPNWSIQPEFAAVLPAYGNLPADLTVQSGALADTPVSRQPGRGQPAGLPRTSGRGLGQGPKYKPDLLPSSSLTRTQLLAPVPIIVAA